MSRRLLGSARVQTVAILSVVLLALSGNGQAAMLYTTTIEGEINQSNLDGTGLQTIVNDPGPYFRSVAPDPINGQLYVADAQGQRIVRVNADGSGLTTLITGTGNLVDVEVDPVAGKVYWLDLDAGEIRRANLNGSGQQTIVAGFDNSAVADFALDLTGGKLYWSDSAGVFGIRRADLDGSSVETLFSDSLWHVTLDVAGGKIYGSAGTSLVSANMDGSGSVGLVENTPPVGDVSVVAGLFYDPFSDRIYYTQDEIVPATLGFVRSVNTDGSGDQLLYAIGSQGDQVVGVTVLLDDNSAVPEPSTALLFGVGGLLLARYGQRGSRRATT